MKNLLLFIFLCSSTLLFSQVGIGTTTPNTKSMLDVNSSSDGLTYKGFMPPRVATNVQRNSINPGLQDFGLLIFVEESGCLQMWDGDSWEDVKCVTVAIAEVWINELHYDNVGLDTGEGFEIAGAAGTDLTDYAIHKYNGSSGQTYGAPILLSGVLPNQSNGIGVLATTLPADALQNGAPDGIALVKISTGNVVQFLSYEGSFVATNGPANGQMSVDIGVSESNTATPAGSSLQLVGTGNEYSQFTWNSPVIATFGTLNTGQIIN